MNIFKIPKFAQCYDIFFINKANTFLIVELTLLFIVFINSNVC